MDAGDCPVTFNDDPEIGAISVELFNPWIGPNTHFLIQFNAKYSPCMREDTAIAQRLRQQRQDECGSRVTYPNGAPAFNEKCAAQFQGASPLSFGCLSCVWPVVVRNPAHRLGSVSPPCMTHQRTTRSIASRLRPLYVYDSATACLFVYLFSLSVPLSLSNRL